jgi:uncharacterized membrane protein
MNLIKVFLQIHIATGVLVLILGMLQIVLPKHGKRHRVLGRLYYYGMTSIFLTSIVLCLFDYDLPLFSRVFLAVVALFSYYSALMGMRFGKYKVLPKPLLTDKIIATCGMLSWLGMLGVGVWCLLNKNYTAAIILDVFSVIFGWAVITDFRKLVLMNSTDRLFDPRSWLLNHSGRILGSYIAATTAFCVNVSPFPFQILNWLVPSAMGFILIPYFSRKVRKMIGPNRRSAT